MNRYRYILLLMSLFALAGCLKQGDSNKREAAASAQEPAQIASTRQTAEPGRNAAAATAPAERRPLINYSTSGAAVQLEHDYDGRMEPDVTETLTLQFRHEYTAGSMRVEFYAHDDLELYNAETPRVLQLDAAQPLILPIELTAPAAGEYYLSIFATVESADGEVAQRIFGLDLKAGDDMEIAGQGRRSQKIDSVQETASGERIIVMPAQEAVASPDR